MSLSSLRTIVDPLSTQYYAIFLSFSCTASRGLNTGDIDSLRQKLRALAEKNLDGATFEERRDIVSKLDVKIYPSEDLKTMRVRCGVNLVWDDIDDTPVQCGKIIFAPPGVSIGRTPIDCFLLPYGGIGRL